MKWKNIININELQFERDDPSFAYEVDPRGFSSAMGAKKLGWNISRIPPGEVSSPYHFHHSEEELFLVISGSAILRQANHFRKVDKGDLIFFSADADGAHQFYNESNEWFAYLALSTLDPFDLAEFPDSAKLSVRNANIRKVFETKSAVPYFKGEENPLKNWPSNVVRKV